MRGTLLPVCSASCGTWKGPRSVSEGLRGPARRSSVGRGVDVLLRRRLRHERNTTQAGRACASRHPAAGRGQGRGARGDARTRPALTRGARHAPASQVRHAVGGSGAASAPDPGWESGPRQGHGRLSPQAQRAARWGRGPRARGRRAGGHGNSSPGAAVGTEQPSSGCTRLPPAGLS